MNQRNYMRLLSLDSNVVQSRPGTNAVNVGGGEVWNFGTYVDGTNNHSKWLTLQRAPQLGSGGFALETVKEVQLITNAVLGGVRRPLGRRRQHDHQERHQRVSTARSFVMLRPGDLDARPPLARVDVPYNQQQVGGVIGGPLVQDKAFYFGSYEYRRERSEVAISSVASPVPSVETPADEHQGHFRARLPLQPTTTRWRVRYNMVRWQKDNESGGLNLPGTGFIWDNNVDTVHGTFTTRALVAVPERGARRSTRATPTAAPPSATR